MHCMHAAINVMLITLVQADDWRCKGLQLRSFSWGLNIHIPLKMSMFFVCWVLYIVVSVISHLLQYTWAYYGPSYFYYAMLLNQILQNNFYAFPTVSLLCKVYGNHVQEDHPQEGYITCYLGNAHRYNYEEHSYMLPR